MLKPKKVPEQIEDKKLSLVIENQVFNMVSANPEGGILIEEYPGLRVRKTPVSHCLANILSWTHPPTEELGQSLLLKITQDFAREQKSFGVFLNDLGLQKLAESLGLKKIARYLSVVCDEKNLSEALFQNVPDEVWIKEADDSDRDVFLEVYSKSFDLPLETAKFFVDQCYLSSAGLPSRNYLAFVKGQEKAVGFASTLDYPRGSIYAMLGGGGVLKEYRGKGIYRALLARRVLDLREQGKKKKLICMADEKTSAPILKQNGFSQLSTHDFYGYFPEHQNY